MKTLLISLLLIGLVYAYGVKPYQADRAFLQYRKAIAQKDAKQAEKCVLRALSLDPGNSQYSLYAGQFYMDILRDYTKADLYFSRTLEHFNGDLTLWSVYYGLGLLKYRTGQIHQAKAAFERSLYYYPLFKPAQEQLEQVNKVLRDHKQILIRLK